MKGYHGNWDEYAPAKRSPIKVNMRIKVPSGVTVTVSFETLQSLYQDREELIRRLKKI